jgi:outer membrane protein assembly factor BamA
MGGLSFTSRDVFTKGERFKFTGTYSTNSYRSFSASYGIPKSFGDIGEPYFSLDYQRSPRWSYFGPGNSSDVNDRVAVDLEATVVGLGWHSKVRHHIRADFSAGHGTYNLYDGDDPNREGNLDTIADEFGLPPAEISSSRLWFVGLDLAHDTRNSLGRTTSGGYHKARLSYYHGLSISQGLEFTRANIDLHQFVNVFSSRTLVFRVMAEETWHSDDSPETPFYLNNTLGGAQDLRGFQVRRFEGDDRMLASLEYRYPIWDVVDAFVFFDEGRVFESMSSEFSWRDWHWSSGFGIRMWGSGGVKLVASAGFSNESPQYFFRFSESI